MTTPNPITPPLNLVQKWIKQCDNSEEPRWQEYEQDIATRAAQWGADQELEACCEWLSVPCPSYGRELRNARRPKTPSLKEQALEIVRGTPVNSAGLYSYEDVEIICRALEQLDD
jgi:hypothetical protein